MSKKMKKAAKNSYYFFITENKAKYELERGYRLRNFDEASKLFAPEWSKLTKEEKLPYEIKAKQAKEDGKLNMDNKFTVLGQTYTEVDRNIASEAELKNIMNGFIDSLTSGPETLDRMYIFAKANPSLQQIIDKKRKQFWPNEISFVAFSIKDGIKAIYSQMIDICEAPTGYASEAKACCEETLLPLPGDPKYTADCRDYLQILKNINGFANHWLKDGYNVKGHRKVFFALNDELIPVLNSIEWLVEQIPDHDAAAKRKYQKFTSNLKMYPLTGLVLAMAKNANRVNPNYLNYLVTSGLDGAANQVLSKGNYDYREEIACYFHRMDGSMKMHVCSQSVVMRRAYMLFEEFLPAYQLPKLDRHQIDKLSGKLRRGPMINAKRRKLSPKVTQPVAEPDWMKSSDDKREGKNESPTSTQTSPVRTEMPWGRSPSESGTTLEDKDFPTLGAQTTQDPGPAWMSGGGGAPSSRSSFATVSGGRGRGGGIIMQDSVSSTSSNTERTFMDDIDDYPSLQSAGAGRGRGRGGR